MIPKRPRISIGACDVHTDAGRGLFIDQRRGDLWRVRGEDAQRGGGGAQETRGETSAAIGWEHTEREHVHLDGGSGGLARG